VQRNENRRQANNGCDDAFLRSEVRELQSRETAMNEVLSKFDGGEIIGLIAVAGAFLCGILGICLGFYYQWHESRRTEIMAGLKQELLNRGMSAEEIQTVLEAGSNSPFRRAHGRHSCRV
jgi:hypothetical protein